jgi:hypothetical protein
VRRLKGFSITEPPRTFLERFEAHLSGSPLGHVVRARLEASQVRVELVAIARSEILFDVVETGGRYHARLARETISFAHRPLRAGVEAQLASALEKLGAEVQWG